MEKANPDKPVTDAQLGAALGLSAEKVAFYLQAGKNPQSLDDTNWQPNTQRESEPQPLEEVLEDTHTSYADEVLVEVRPYMLLTQTPPISNILPCFITAALLEQLVVGGLLLPGLSVLTISRLLQRA